MQDVMFVLKCLVVTAVLIVAMQIRIGHQTAEGHMMSWLHHSTVSNTLNDVAAGAVKAGKNGKNAVMNLVGANEPIDEAPAPTEASTGGWFKIKRSAAYYRQKEREQSAHTRQSRSKADEQSKLNEGDFADDASVERD